MYKFNYIKKYIYAFNFSKSVTIKKMYQSQVAVSFERLHWYVTKSVTMKE